MTYRLSILSIALVAVALAGCQTATGRTTGTSIDDGSTTAAVKSKLVADRAANLTSVGVDTVNGSVHLTGAVDTPEQRMRAEQLAWEVPGVRQVANNIQVQRPPAVLAPSGTVAASPAVVRRSVVGTVSSVDAARSQVTVATGTEQLLIQLPQGVVRDLRPGDQVTLDLGVRPR
jgi:hyperosmotically inducible periplasmic protein